MSFLKKSKTLSKKQQEINTLKEELRHCEKLIEQSTAMFDMTTDENLIEARIYQLKSLNKHHDYLLSEIKQLMQAKQQEKSEISV